MSTANAVAMAAAFAGYLVYSDFLSPSDFGLYAAAVAIAKFGNVILDGGLKLTLVKQRVEIKGEVLKAIFIGSLTAGLAFSVLVAGGLWLLVLYGSLLVEESLFLLGYVASYFLAYPVILMPLAALERQQRFVPIAWAEGLSVSVEYALPAALWLFVDESLWVFPVGALFSRVIRAAVLLSADKAKVWRKGVPLWRPSGLLLKEGFSLQCATLLSTLRDNMHVFLVGPLFGREWVGFYAWALQLCSVASQVFVQTAARVGLPSLVKAEGGEERWQVATVQISWVAILTLPPVIFLYFPAAVVNAAFFDGKWGVSLLLLPALAIRMLPGAATTPLGYLLVAERDGAVFAKSIAIWTTLEFLLALLCLSMWGPMGLAVAYSFTAWVGVVCFLRGLEKGRELLSVGRLVLARPSLWVSIAGAASMYGLASDDVWILHPIGTFVLCLTGVVLAYLAEQKVREVLVGVKRK